MDLTPIGEISDIVRRTIQYPADAPTRIHFSALNLKLIGLSARISSLAVITMIELEYLGIHSIHYFDSLQQKNNLVLDDGLKEEMALAVGCFYLSTYLLGCAVSYLAKKKDEAKSPIPA